MQHIQATNGAFAAILADHSIITWGDPSCGGALGSCYLKNVLHIEATGRTFAAILADGSMVTWGDPSESPDGSTILQHRVLNL